MTDNLHGGGDGDPVPVQILTDPARLNLENHCLFCLQPQQAKTLLKVARRNPKLMKNPSPIIRYLTGTDQSCGRSDENYENVMGVPITTRFPSMTCAACYDILEELCRLHEKLLEVQRLIQKEAELVRELIIKSQEASSSTVSSRQKFYSKIQSSKMPVEEIRTVAMFVDNFHSTLVFEASANHNAELPSGSDPDLVSNAGDHASASDNSKQDGGDFEMMKMLDPKTNVKFEYEKDGADKDGEKLLQEFNEFEECSNSKNAEADSSSNECDLGNRNIDDYVPSPPDQSESSSSSSSCSSSSSYSPLPKKRIRKKLSNDDGKDHASTRPRSPRTRRSTTIKSTSSQMGSNSTEIKIAGLPKVMKRPKSRTISIKSQHCDICGELCHFPDLRNHLEGTHNVQDFLTECPNPSCPYIFSCRGKMEKHIKSFPHCRNIANLPKTLKCETCNLDIQKTEFLNHLEKHEKQGGKDKVMLCPIPGCSDRYAIRQSLEEHLFIHDGRISKRPKQQECSICKQLLKVGNVKAHLQEVHEVKEVISCRRCPFLFHNWEFLLDHLEKHGLTHRHRSIGGGKFICGICNDGVDFRRYESFRQHFFNLHKIGKTFYCEFCGNQFFSQTTLSLHKQKCQSSSGSDQVPTKATKKPNKKSFVCDQCPDTRFQKKTSLQSHKIKEHGADPVTCKFCGDAFQSPSMLVQHEREHLGLVRTYKCKVKGCGKTYHLISKLKFHELSAHNLSVNLVICEICGKGWKSKMHLSAHKKRVHDKIKGPRRICEICGESFSCLTTLKRHNLIHTGARPHPCPICGQAFRHREVLKTHINSHQEKGDNFKPNGPMKNIRKRVVNATKTTPTK